MKKFRLLALIAAIYLVPSTASAQEVVTSGELTFRIEGSSVLRLSTKVAPIVKKLTTAQCKEIGAREGLRLKAEVTAIDSIVVKRPPPNQGAVAEGSAHYNCYRK